MVALYSQNEWLGRQARRILQERAGTGENVAKEILGFMWNEDKPLGRNYERRAWALAAVGAITKENYQELAKNDYSGFWLMKFGVEAGNLQAIAELEKKLETTTDIGTRLRLASIFQKLPDNRKRELVRKLVTPTPDANLSLMDWFAVEPLASGEMMARFQTAKDLQDDEVVRKFVRRTVSRSEDIVGVRDQLIHLFCKTPMADAKWELAAFLGVRDAVEEQPAARMPFEWNKIDFSKRTPAVRAIAEELAVKFGDETQIDVLRVRLADPKAEPAERFRAISLLINRKTAGLVPSLLALFAEPSYRPIAIRGLANYSDERIPAAILNVYPKLTAEEKADAVQTLASRATYAMALLNAVEKGDVPKADITAFTARQITALKDQSVLGKLGTVWGEVKPASATRTVQISKYKELLTPDALKSGNAGNGRSIFAKNCATCHKMYGEGQAVGPELTGAQRSNLDYILENVIDPSAVVANEYKMHEFQLLDGRVVTGIVKKESPQAITVRTVNEELVIPVSDIDKRKPTQNSVMPEGLFDAMKPDDVRDLVAYLMGKEQVPLPK